jgi:hypothetical protein
MEGVPDVSGDADPDSGYNVLRRLQVQLHRRYNDSALLH